MEQTDKRRVITYSMAPFLMVGLVYDCGWENRQKSCLMMNKKKVNKVIMQLGEYQIGVLAVWYVHSKNQMMSQKYNNNNNKDDSLTWLTRKKNFYSKNFVYLPEKSNFLNEKIFHSWKKICYTFPKIFFTLVWKKTISKQK